jgi:hypothetical protein
MLRFLNLLIVLSGWFMVSTLQAADMKWSQVLPDNPKFPYLKIIGGDDEGFFVLRSNISLDTDRERAGLRSRRYFLQYYSLEMMLKWEGELNAPSDDARFADIKVVSGRVLVVTYDQDRSTRQLRFYAQYLGTGGAFVGSPRLIDTVAVSRLDEDDKPGILLNRDESQFVFTYRKVPSDGSRQSFEAVLLDTALNLLYRKDIPLEADQQRFSPLRYVLTERGNFYILGIEFLTEKKVKAPGESYYRLLGYQAAPDRIVNQEIRVQDRFLTDVSLAADNRNNRIVVAGFYSDKTNYSTSGVFYYGLDEDGLTATKVLTAPFSQEFFKKTVGDRRDRGSGELVNYSIDRIILRNDGGAVVVAESFYQTTRTYWDFYMQASVTHYYYHFGNILLISMDPAGGITWGNVVQKDQNSIDDSGYYSSYCSAVSNGLQYSLYNKYIDDDSSVLMTIVDGKGAQRTETLFNEVERVAIIPRSARQLDEETLLLPAYRQNKLHFVRITF